MALNLHQKFRQNKSLVAVAIGEPRGRLRWVVMRSAMTDPEFRNMIARVDLQALDRGDEQAALLPVQAALSDKKEAELAEFPMLTARRTVIVVALVLLWRSQQSNGVGVAHFD